MLPGEEQVLCQPALMEIRDSKWLKARRLTKVNPRLSFAATLGVYKISQNLQRLLCCLGAERNPEPVRRNEFSGGRNYNIVIFIFDCSR
jgi:hypothetical protein